MSPEPSNLRIATFAAAVALTVIGLVVIEHGASELSRTTSAVGSLMVFVGAAAPAIVMLWRERKSSRSYPVGWRGGPDVPYEDRAPPMTPKIRAMLQHDVDELIALRARQRSTSDD